MDHEELHDPLEWLRRTIMIGEKALRTELAMEVREEWMLTLERKRALLRELEQLNDRLLSSSASTHAITEA